MTVYRLPYPPTAGQGHGPKAYWIQVGSRKVLAKYAHTYRFLVAAAVRDAVRTHDPNGVLQMRVSVHPPDRMRRDWDNIRKVLMDALVACNKKVKVQEGKKTVTRYLDIPALKDDSNKHLVREWCEWLEVDPDGRVEIELTNLGGGR